ncbi:hypothetical protein BCV70DRAFT_203160 [Testicularia cyperi]|uniref:Pentacotripeptide-repeat region of PRORP domain-containing protein n=1 Tax=Testicularia cyperi TaxID=1882483 RepID=A0A317XH01_9BASI|nr:hypothetical protein BCV70DRAFT_203160 [Testicularia cyperi]
MLAAPLARSWPQQCVKQAFHQLHRNIELAPLHLPVSQTRTYAAPRSSFAVYTPRSKPSGPRRKKTPPRPNARESASSLVSANRSRILLSQAGASAIDKATPSLGLLALRRALRDHDPAAAWHTWSAIESDSSLAQLDRDDHASVLQLCASMVSNPGQRDKLAEQWHERFSRFAHACVETGDVQLLTDWLKLLTCLHRYETVTSVWDHLVSRRLSCANVEATTSACFGEQSQLSQGIDKSPVLPDDTQSFVRLDGSVTGGRVDLHDLVCIVVFAFATVSRPSRLAASLEKVEIGSPFRGYLRVERAQDLYQELRSKMPRSASTPSTVIDLAAWETMHAALWRAEIARGLSSGSGGPQRIARMLGSLFQMRRIDSAFKVFETALIASTGDDAWLAIEGVKSSAAIPASRARWTESCWLVCLSNFIAFGRSDLAMKVWSHFHALRLRPTSRIWNSLLDGYARAKNFEAASKTWGEVMKQCKASPSDTTFPDEQMYTTMINILFRERKADEAMGLFSEMISRSDRHGGKLQLPAETYNAIINGLCVNGQHSRAQTLLEGMRKDGPPPTIGTINTFLRAHARVGDLQSLATALRMIGELGLTPDVVTFTTTLDALLRKGGQSGSDSVVKCLNIMEEMGVKANAVTYTAMIKACLVGAEAANVDLASSAMFGDGKSAERNPDAAEARIDAALDLLDRMIQAKVAPTEITYTALIGGCLQNPDAVMDAFRRKAIPSHYTVLPARMERLGEKPTVLRRWQTATPDVSLALLLFDQMRARGLPVTATTYHYLIEGLCSTRTDRAAFLRSIDLMDEMLLGPGSATSSNTRQPGPILSSVTGLQTSANHQTHALSHTTWIVILSSLLDRLENGPREPETARDCAKALKKVVRLVRDAGTLSGSEGGLSLPRLVERAAGLTVRG